MKTRNCDQYRLDREASHLSWAVLGSTQSAASRWGFYLRWVPNPSEFQDNDQSNPWEFVFACTPCTGEYVMAAMRQRGDDNSGWGSGVLKMWSSTRLQKTRQIGVPQATGVAYFLVVVSAGRPLLSLPLPVSQRQDGN